MFFSFSCREIHFPTWEIRFPTSENLSPTSEIGRAMQENHFPMLLRRVPTLENGFPIQGIRFPGGEMARAKREIRRPESISGGFAGTAAVQKMW